MVSPVPYLPRWKRQVIALISTITLFQSGVLARSPEGATTLCGKMTLDDKPRHLACDVSRCAFMDLQY
jgi:hypothetical protein